MMQALFDYWLGILLGLVSLATAAVAWNRKLLLRGEKRGSWKTRVEDRLEAGEKAHEGIGKAIADLLKKFDDFAEESREHRGGMTKSLHDLDKRFSVLETKTENIEREVFNGNWKKGKH